MKQVDPVLVEGRIKIPYRWPARRVAGRFLEILRSEKRFEGLRCARCRQVTVPPRPCCPACGAREHEPLTVGPTGTVTTWTRRPQGLFALVCLDGADTAILHRLLGVDSPRSGMRVVAVVDDELRGFEPAEA